MLYNAVLVSAAQQSESNICIHLSHLFGFPSHVGGIPCGEYWVEFPMVYSRFSLVIYFIHSSFYVSVPISKFIPFSAWYPYSCSVCLGCFSLNIKHREESILLDPSTIMLLKTCWIIGYLIKSYQIQFFSPLHFYHSESSEIWLFRNLKMAFSFLGEICSVLLFVWKFSFE